jgi:DNA-binding NarL/FixJ family response regulator
MLTREEHILAVEVLRARFACDATAACAAIAEIAEIVRRTELQRLGALTERENAVLVRAAAGDLDKEIADSLQISTSTVRKHLRALYHKLQVRGRGQLGGFIARAGGITFDT